MASARGDEVGEAAVEVVERARERLLQRPAAVELVGEVDADDLGVVLGEEADAALLVDAAQPVVVRDVAVVDGREVGDAAGPERLRVGQVDPALGGQARVADAVAAPEALDIEGRRRGWPGWPTCFTSSR